MIKNEGIACIFAPMDSMRQKRVNSLLLHDLSEIINHYERNFFKGTLISVTEVRVSPDMGTAKVYVSVFPIDRSKQVMEILKTHSSSIRRDLGTKVRKSLRVTPELQLILDDTLERKQQIDDLLKGKGENPIK